LLGTLALRRVYFQPPLAFFKSENVKWRFLPVGYNNSKIVTRVQTTLRVFSASDQVIASAFVSTWRRGGFSSGKQEKRKIHVSDIKVPGL